MKNILDYNKTIITLDEMGRFFNVKEYMDLYNIAQKLIADCRIKPVKSNGLNGKNPPLYKKYRIVKDKVDEEGYIEEMKISFPPILSIDYYKRNIEKYIEHREYIMLLGDYFKYNREALKSAMSINERSFDIWGEEKFLKDNSLSGTILKNLGLVMGDLNIYKTPEPFFYYIKNTKTSNNILIIENKDTWYTMRKLMMEDYKQCFFDMDFYGVIYGEGKKIVSSFEEIKEQEDERLKDEDNIYYYFGDLDFEGVSIYTSLKKKSNNIKDIKLFKRAYLKMIELSCEDKLKTMKKHQIKNGYKEFLNEFDMDTQIKMINMLEKGLYIPQEIINYQVLKG
jgi:hypothetical protein